jgi:hypothetical protein
VKRKATLYFKFLFQGLTQNIDNSHKTSARLADIRNKMKHETLNAGSRNAYNSNDIFDKIHFMMEIHSGLMEINLKFVVLLIIMKYLQI